MRSTRDTPSCAPAYSDSVGNAFRVEIAEELERQHRVNRGQMYRIFAEILEPPDGPEDPDLPAGTVISKLLWQRLRITTAEVDAAWSIAARIRPRRALTGPQLEPELPSLAAAVEEGEVGDDHIAAVCRALDALPSAVPEAKKRHPNESWSVTQRDRTPSSSSRSAGISPKPSTLTVCSTRTTAPAAVG